MLSREQYVEGVKTTFRALAKKILIAEIAKAIPFLASPVLNPVVSKIIDWALGVLIDGAETGIFFKYIDMRVGEQKGDFEKAVSVLLNSTPEERHNAEAQVIEAFRRFAKFNS